MAERASNIRVIKKVASQAESSTMGASEMRDYLMGEWHETLMKLARLAKLLKISRRCKHCGNAL